MNRLFVITLLLLCKPLLVASCCANACSGHGVCTAGTCTCACFSQWTGGDCSERTCPSGKQWVGDASATDTIHDTMTECSGVGSCARNTGLCKCQAGFEGMACERMTCPLSCSGNGKCVALSEAAALKDDRNFFRSLTYTTIWDNDKIFGCQCDEGYYGVSCSQRHCITGDDPVTTGQVDEVQVLECTCAATCSGGFYLTFRGATTNLIPHDATATQVKAKLVELTNILDISVAFSSGVAVCGAAGIDTTITFTHTPGDVPSVIPSLGTLASSGVAPTLVLYHDGQTSAVSTVTTVVGTKENAYCNNRGSCNSATGQCTCYTDFSSSDGSGTNTAGNTGDCGYHASGPSACPGAISCSGKGTCSGAADYTCSCYAGYFGSGCEYRSCPAAKAWFAEPGQSLPGFVSVSNGGTTVTTTADLRTLLDHGDALHINGQDLTVHASTALTSSTVELAAAYTGATVAYAEAYRNPSDAHHEVECSGRGTCDTGTGTCSCVAGFTGSACQRLACPVANGLICGGQGRCESLARLAELTEDNGDATAFTYGLDRQNLATWDHDKLFGCACDKKLVTGGLSDFSGHDCTVRQCVRGDDPSTSGVDEVQTITCTATSGSFAVTFRQQSSAAILFDATAAEVEAALEALSTIKDVSVAFDAGVAACSGAGVVISVTFHTNFGDLPAMSTDVTSLQAGAGTATVAQSVAGTREDAECANHGNCDRTLGICKCHAGYVSSNGAASAGSIGDCGARDVLALG